MAKSKEEREREIARTGPNPETQTVPQNPSDPPQDPHLISVTNPDGSVRLKHSEVPRQNEIAGAIAAQSDPVRKLTGPPIQRVTLHSGRFSGHYPEELPDAYLRQAVNSVTSSGNPFGKEEVKALQDEWARRQRPPATK